jgi:hypothetical protein
MTQLPLPDDLLQAYVVFTALATKHGFAYAGMMMGSDPPSLLAIGNVTENGHELAELLREYADILEEKTDKGQLERSPFRDPH